MSDQDSNQKEIQRLKNEYEKFTDKIYELKMKKLGILAKYREKLDEKDLSMLRKGNTNG